MGKELADRLNLMVVCARVGRIMAKIGGLLTSKEQEQINEVYSRLKSNQIIPDTNPANAFITSEMGRKGKISLSDAVDWFVEKYPSWSLPLQRKRKEAKPPPKKTLLVYGLRGEEDFSDEFYERIIVEVTGMPSYQAKKLYERIVLPQLSKSEELEGMIKTTIKNKN